MAKEANTIVASGWHELFRSAVYKRSQGRIARQVTFAVLAVILAFGAWTLRQLLIEEDLSVQVAVAGGVLLVGLWLAYRVVNIPRFADFLIAVEAEMNKVSWPGRAELFRASVVVIFTIFGLAILLFGYDVFWQWFLTLLGVLQRPPLAPVTPVG